MTFSIVARDARTGQLGVGAITAMMGVGKLVTHARAGIGAMATQASVNPYLAINGLKRLAEGLTAEHALDEVLAEDPGAAFRQCGCVDAAGRAAAWTGERTPGWSGHLTADGVAVQGNRLVGVETLEAALEAFRARNDLELAWRILVALEAGEETGADREGAVSGNILVVDTEEYPLWDARMDESEDPAAALRSLMQHMEDDLIAQIRRLPTHEDPLGELVRAQLKSGRSPQQPWG